MTRSSQTRLRFAAPLALMLAAFVLPLKAAPLRDVPQTLVQPDGTQVACFASGDEFYHWLHDASGYPIVQDPASGAWVYACFENGEPAPTNLLAGMADPAAAGLKPGPGLSPERYLALRDARSSGSAARPEAIPMAPHTGILNSITIFVRFSDEAEFTDTLAFYEDIYGSAVPGFNSLRNYFMDASYQKLEILSHFFPTTAGDTVLSFQDAYPRGYYKKKSVTNPDGYATTSQRNSREWTLLQAAVVAVGPQVPADLVIDGDGDGLVDGVSFVISGAPEGWSDLLWPHMWSMGAGYHPTINGKLVSVYDFQLQKSVHSDGNGVLCHEMFHVLGAPDLYHYYNGTNLSPAYTWDIMEYTANPPQHMGAYMKHKYGHWIEAIPEISTAGSYTLNPLTSAEGQVYQIPCPLSPDGEFFVVEFRKKGPPFESRIPDSGLLVYRINPGFHGNADYNPARGIYDEVYIYRPGGTLTQNGSPSAASFTSDACRVQITDTTDPPDFLTDGSLGGLVLTHAGSAAGETTTFQLDAPQACQISCLSFPSATEGPAPLEVYFDAWDNSCQCTTASGYTWDFGDGSGTQDGFPTHTYAAPGTYTYKLTVEADPGATCTSQGTITVTAPPCALSCTASATPESGHAPLAVQFSGSVAPANCAGDPVLRWTFGDGTASAEANPSHTYASQGIYTWRIEVSLDGAACTQSGSVEVTAPQVPGDCDGDGTVSIGEVQKAVTMFLGLLPPACGVDCDGDGTVSIGEVQKVVNAFLGMETSC